MLKPYCIQGVIEAGCDEAGRGPLAGGVFAAAVILPQWAVGDSCDRSSSTIPTDEQREVWYSLCEGLNDSKQLSEKERYRLRPLIEQIALSWAVVEVTAQEIDKINILNASIIGMQRAISQLKLVPEHIIVDGNKWKPYIPAGQVFEIPARTVVHGDATYMSIAAASILAKTYRDDYMLRLDKEFPQYHWAENKGYPTAAHYAALKTFGPSPYHRQTFRLQ